MSSLLPLVSTGDKSVITLSKLIDYSTGGSFDEFRLITDHYLNSVVTLPKLINRSRPAVKYTNCDADVIM